MLATILAITKTKSYDTYMGCKLGVLMEAASKSSDLSKLVSGMNSVLRNASAHRDFGVRDDCVVIHSGSAEVVLTAASSPMRSLNSRRSYIDWRPPRRYAFSSEASPEDQARCQSGWITLSSLPC